MQADFKSLIINSGLVPHPVVPFNPRVDKLVAIDLSVTNTAFTREIFSDIECFTQFMNTYREKNEARYAAGGYAEHRQMYSFSNVFDSATDAQEPRRLHLGIDIWGNAFTPVHCPLPGKVHSSGHNNARGDYGGTVILQHSIESRSFYTLYGHLSEASVNNNVPGREVNAGQIFAYTGPPAENGFWPPHLHFQIVMDLQGWSGDYPGVCKYSEREKWLANSPDGDILLGLGNHLKPSG